MLLWKLFFMQFMESWQGLANSLVTLGHFNTLMAIILLFSCSFFHIMFLQITINYYFHSFNTGMRKWNSFLLCMSQGILCQGWWSEIGNRDRVKDINIHVWWTAKYFSIDYRNLRVTLDELNLVNHFGLSYQTLSWTAILLLDTSKY